MNGPLLGDDPAVRVSYTLRLWRRPGLSPPWVVPAPRGRNAEVFEHKTTRRELELVRDARPEVLCPRRGDPAPRPGDRSNPVERVIDVTCRSLEPRAFALQPPAPGGAAVRPARIADLGVPTPPREGVNAATPTTADRGEGCPGSTSGSGLYQQLYLQRRPARCLKPHRLTPFRVTSDVMRAPVHTAHERLMPCLPWSTGAGPGELSTAERLRDALVHGDVAQLEPDEQVMDV